MNYLALRVKAGERWSYQPPAGHAVLWIAVGMGSVLVPDELQHGELVAFTGQVLSKRRAPMSEAAA